MPAREDLFGRPLIEHEQPPPYQSYEIHPRAFTARQCRRIVGAAPDHEVGDAALEGEHGESVHDSAIRRSRTGWLAPDDETWWIYERLAAVARRANRRYGFDLTGFTEDLQFTVYDSPGAFYSWHQDGLDSGVAGRKLSIVVQLSDPGDYVGAELEFFQDVDAGDERRAWFADVSTPLGTAVVFPSFEYHRVRPLRSGIRRSLVAWVGGPPFR
ncbi:MAG: 2OG-Fe(II) oxygenase [Microthrixaceae bacterium]